MLKLAEKYKGNIKKLYATNFLIKMQFFSGILIPFLTEWGKISFTQIMILQSWCVGWIFILEIPTGTIADYFGRKLSLILGYITMFIGVFAYSISPKFIMFLLGEFFWALSASLNSGTFEAMIYDTLKITNKEKESKKIFSHLNSFSILGVLIAAPLGSVIAAYISLRASMLFVVIPVSIAIIIGFTLKEPTEKSKRSKKKYLTFLKEGMKIFKKDNAVRWLTLDGLVIAVLSYFMTWLYQPRLEMIGVKIKYFGIINSIFIAAEIGVVNIYDKLERFLRSKKATLMFSAIVTGIGFFFIALTNNVYIVIIGIIVSIGFGIPRIVFIRNYINKHIETEKRATIMSATSMMQQFVLMIINPFFGLIAENSLIPVSITFGLIAIGWAIITPIREKHLID